MSTHYYMDLGRYNLASTKKEWMLALVTTRGRVSETWPEDDKPEVCGLLPSEVLDLIDSRLDSYWYKSSRDKDKAEIATIREHANEIDIDWLDGRIKAAESKLAELRERRAAFVADIAEVTE